VRNGRPPSMAQSCRDATRPERRLSRATRLRKRSAMHAEDRPTFGSDARPSLILRM
jgi:hypothetical protein